MVFLPLNLKLRTDSQQEVLSCWDRGINGKENVTTIGNGNNKHKI
jgi:hypothetical protein